MAFQLLPGVLVTEEDRTTIVPSVATTAGAFAGAFKWGPVDEVVTIDSEINLVERFGKPNDTNAGYFFTAANFLSYGNNLQLIRVVDKGSARNAVSSPSGGVTGVTIINSPDYFTTSSAITVTFQAPTSPFGGTTAQGTAVLSTAGVVDRITLDTQGFGYSRAPNVLLVGGGGTGATANASFINGELNSVSVSAVGNNYNSSSNVVIENAALTGSSANLTITYSVVLDAIVDGGTNYIAGNANIQFIGGNIFSGASASASLIIDPATGAITGLTFTSPGSGYTTLPTVVINRNDSNAGTNANITVSLAYGAIRAINVVSRGIGHYYTPNVIINRNNALGGADAVATATIQGIVGDIQVRTRGSGYTSKPTVVIVPHSSDSPISNATANAVLSYAVNSVNVTVGGAGYLISPNISITSGNLSVNANVQIDLNSVLILNDDNYDSSFSSGGLLYGEFAARYPGDLGNANRVSMADANTFNSWAYASQFDAAPGTSSHASVRGGSNDELHIIVIDSTAAITGTAGTVLEKFSFVSKAYDAKNSDASTNYYKDVINNQSAYIRWLNHPSGTSNWGTTSSNKSFNQLTAAYNVILSEGNDGSSVSISNLSAGYSVFSNDELYDISLIPLGPTTEVAVVNAVIGIAESRRDCIVFVSPPYADVVNTINQATKITTYRDSLTSSSFAVLDSGWKYQYDRYNDKYRYVPLNGDVAGLAARTDYVADPWFSPAGYNRGIIKNVVKLAYSPSKTDRDNLYKKGVNPVVTFPGQGTLLFGDKTLLARPSAFDRINVRRLFIVLEKAIATAAKFQLFEFNDAFTSAQFRNLVEPFLRDVQGRRGITDFRVICDDTNNTAEVVNRNEFVADIFIKPARSINFIQLNFVATRSGVSFEEVGA